jgi:hypothetical protein
LTKPTQTGPWKGKLHLCHNCRYTGDRSKVNLVDLLAFLSDSGVDLSRVEVPETFSTKIAI